MIVAGPELIENPGLLLKVVTVSAPVVTLTDRRPSVDVGSMLMLAVRSVGDETVTDVAVIPVPIFTVVTP